MFSHISRKLGNLFRAFEKIAQIWGVHLLVLLIVMDWSRCVRLDKSTVVGICCIYRNFTFEAIDMVLCIPIGLCISKSALWMKALGCVIVNQQCHIGKRAFWADLWAWVVVEPALLQSCIQDQPHLINIILTATGLQTKDPGQNWIVSTRFGPRKIDNQCIHWRWSRLWASSRSICHERQQPLINISKLISREVGHQLQLPICPQLVPNLSYNRLLLQYRKNWPIICPNSHNTGSELAKKPI